jgi:hypothetical protein
VWVGAHDAPRTPAELLLADSVTHELLYRQGRFAEIFRSTGFTRRLSPTPQGAGPAVAVPQRRRRLDPDTGRYRGLSDNQRDVNAAHARRRGPRERVNAELKNWKILRKIRSSPSRAAELVTAVQTLMIANA